MPLGTYTVNWSAVAAGILQASVSGEPGSTIFNAVFSTRKLGDITNDGSCTSTDALRATQYGSDPASVVDVAERTYISGTLGPRLLSDIPKYIAYLSVVQPASKTFADMLQELRSRLKLHATLGSTPALESILTEANEYVFEQLDNGLPYQSTLTLTANTATYAFETDGGLPVARGSVQAVWIEQGSSNRVPLPQGISHAQRAFSDLRAIPERYDTAMTNDEFRLEVWPTPDQAYTLHVDHNRILTRFTASTDSPSAPYRLVLGYAIAIGKAHYGQADAELAGQAFKTLLAREREKQRENRRFIPPTTERRSPQVVSTASGYRQV